MEPVDQQMFDFTVPAKTDLVLQPAPNGGWVVLAATRNTGLQHVIIGAFSSSNDLIFAMTSALLRPDGAMKDNTEQGAA